MVDRFEILMGKLYLLHAREKERDGEGRFTAEGMERPNKIC